MLIELFRPNSAIFCNVLYGPVFYKVVGMGTRSFEGHFHAVKKQYDLTCVGKKLIVILVRDIYHEFVEGIYRYFI